MSLQLYSEFAVDSMMQQRENEIFFDIYHYPNTTCKDRRLLRLKRIYNNMQFTQEVVRVRLWRNRGITVRGWDDTGIAQDPEGLLICRVYRNDCNVIEHCQETLQLEFDPSCFFKSMDRAVRKMLKDHYWALRDRLTGFCDEGYYR